MTEEPAWHRLSPRMLLVHPVHEVWSQLPVLIGFVVLGSATGNHVWPLIVLAATVVLGVLRWFFTSYRIDDESVYLRTGVLRRRQLSVPRNRIRSVSVDARLLHRMLGLAVLKLGTGQEASRGEPAFELNGVQAAQVPYLRAVLLADSLGPMPDQSQGRLLARWRPSWLRYAPLSFSGLVTIGAIVGLAYQSGLGVRLQESDLTQAGLRAAQRTGVVVAISVGVIGLLVLSVLFAVVLSWLTYGNLVLRRDAGVLHLRHGLLRVRERTFDMSRLRGGTLRESLPVRLLRGARVNAVMTGVHGEGESSVLLPNCPTQIATDVLSELIADRNAVTGKLMSHGAVATRRRWTRGLMFPLLVFAALAGAQVFWAAPTWWWVAAAVLAVVCALLSADRARSLGHRVADGWLVSRSGSVERTRDCISCAGIIGWTIHQTYFQRRAGVATLVAATAAGRKSYRLLDVPADQAWAVAGAASPWVAESVWSRPARI